MLTFHDIEIKVPVKCLGLTLDHFVNWDEHVSGLCSIVSRRIGVLKRLRFLPKKVLRLIYFSTVHCHLTYCVGVWGSAKKSLIDQLHVLHKEALKATHRLPMRYSTELLFKTQFPNVLTIPRMYELAV
ncbi:hypothetical protein HA402_011367, partial [Bradysia odoriphaga]